MQHAFATLPGPAPLRLEIEDRGDERVVQTPAAHAERRRSQLRALGAVAAVLGLVLAPVHLGFLLLIGIGIAVAAIGPARVERKVLFRVIREPEECLITPLANVMVRSIVSIEGRYETSGWDSRTGIVALLTNGESVSVLDLPGTDESLAQAACEVLSRLCRCNAECTGPFGDTARFGATDH